MLFDHCWVSSNAACTAPGFFDLLSRAALLGLFWRFLQPMNYAEGVHRGFGFVEYEDAEDASEAIFNMDGADLMGRTIKVSMAQQNQLNKLSTTQQAIWSSDEWFQQQVAGDPSPEEQAIRKEQAQDQETLRD